MHKNFATSFDKIAELRRRKDLEGCGRDLFVVACSARCFGR
jgi:hypothetical protein